MDQRPAFKVGTLGPLASVGAHIAAGERVMTHRGQLPIEQVGVGDFVLSGCGRWAQVAVVRKLAYRGPMIGLFVEGRAERVRMTPWQRLAIGPEQWVAIDRLRLGTVVAVPLLGLPKIPATEAEPTVAWLHAHIQAGWVRSCLTTPWGRFCRPVVPLAEFRLMAPRGRYRIVPAGLVGLGDEHVPAVAADGVCLVRSAANPQASLPPGLQLAEQSVRCRRDGDVLSFELPCDHRPAPVKGVPRRVVAAASRGYAGWVFSLSLHGAHSFIASGLLARHWSVADTCNMGRAST